MTDSYDVIVLGSGIAGLAGALAAHEMGQRAIVLEKAALLGGGTVNSYGLIWVGQNHLAQAAGYADSRDDVIAYMGFLSGGFLDEQRMTSFVDRGPEALKFYEDCGVRFRSCAALQIITTGPRRARVQLGGRSKSSSSLATTSATSASVC